MPRRRTRLLGFMTRRDDDALLRARDDFVDALDDLRSPEALDLKSRIATTRSLPELWNFRELVFGEVAYARDQREAERRVAGLNRHFA